MKRTPLKRGKPPRRHVPLGVRKTPVQYGKVRAWVADRADGRCEAAIEAVCAGRGCHAHHLLPRSAGRDDSMGNLLWVCQPCHSHIHANQTWARSVGLLKSRYGT